jgi:hypothetical protein
MTASNLDELTWRKSSYSGNGENINCIEVAKTISALAIRDSKDPQGGVLLIDGASWKILTSRIRRGHLDIAP